ncbi:MAG: hypothetical protein V4602_05090 [Pseudomonadota bacterium]
MRDPIRLLATFVVLVAAAALSHITPVSARGGAAANIMGSPGYQRALEESRKRYRQSYTEPYVRSPSVHSRKTWRHRGRRY